MGSLMGVEGADASLLIVLASSGSGEVTGAGGDATGSLGRGDSALGAGLNDGGGVLRSCIVLASEVAVPGL